jgi:chemotaxis response regulator CheB
MLLDQDKRIEIVAQGSFGADAVSLSEVFTPDVVLFDVEMGKDNAEPVGRQLNRLAAAPTTCRAQSRRDSTWPWTM